VTEQQQGLPAVHDSDALLYDWFKHLTSLSLLTLGGILGISQLVTQSGFKKHAIIVLLVAVGLSGVIGAAAFGAGVGAFLYIFTKAVYK
jgi:hypothetical protein